MWDFVLIWRCFIHKLSSDTAELTSISCEHDSDSDLQQHSDLTMPKLCLVCYYKTGWKIYETI